MSNETMYNADGSRVTWTRRQFQTYLSRLTPEERAYVLHQRKLLGIDKEVARG